MYLGLVLIVMIVSGTYILLSLRNIEINKSRQQLEIYAEKIVEQVIDAGDADSFQEDLQATVTNAMGIQGNVLNAEGETIASTTSPKAPFTQYTDQAVIAGMNGTATFSSGKKSTDSFGLLKEWMSYALPVTDENGNVEYIVYTRLDASDMQSSLNETTKIIIVAVSIALFLTAIMGYVFAQTLTGPILALTRGAKNMAEGKLNQSLKVRSNDEIGQLTSSFNYMAAELRKTMSEISKEKNRMEIILHNMSDGVISFAKDGELMLANTAAEEMLKVDKMDMDFSHFIRAFDISTGVYLDMGDELSKAVTFPVDKQFIHATFSPHYNPKKRNGRRCGGIAGCYRTEKTGRYAERICGKRFPRTAYAFDYGQKLHRNPYGRGTGRQGNSYGILVHHRQRIRPYGVPGTGSVAAFPF